MRSARSIRLAAVLAVAAILPAACSDLPAEPSVSGPGDALPPPIMLASVVPLPRPAA